MQIDTTITAAGLIIRPAQPNDVERLAVLAAQVWMHTYATDGVSSVIARYVLSELTVDKVAAMLAAERYTVLVAEIDVNLVAYAVIDIGAQCPAGEPAVELTTLYVQAHFIGKGIGPALLARGRDIARRRAGSSAIWLSVNAQNARAIAFYTRHGFVRTGTSWFELGGELHENHVMVIQGE